MSVCASVECVTCGISAPAIGDFGHLGYPSLADDEWCHGDLASFEYLYKGWAAIGFLPKNLEAIRAFLVAHQQHEVGLFLDGEEYAERFPPATAIPANAPRLSDQGFVHGHFELECDRCRASFVTQMAQWLRPIESRKVSKAKLDAFTARVLDAPGRNFYRVDGMLDRDGAETRRLGAFLRDHRKHPLTARTSVDADWSGLPVRIHAAAGAVNTGQRELFWSAANVMPHPAGVTPPLTLLWTYDHAQTQREAPLVADGYLYTATRDGEALACLSADGQERWRLDLGKKYGVPAGRSIVVAGDALALALYAERKEDRELLIVDRRTGQVARRTRFAFVYMSVADTGQLIASGAEYGDKTRALGLCDLRDPARPVWLHTCTNAVNGDRSFQRFAAAAGQIYTEWGEDLVALRLSDGEVTWRRSLAEFGGRTYRYPSPVSVSNDTIVLDTNSELLAFDAANGDLRWRRERIQTWPRTVCDGVVYAAEVTQMVDAAPGTVVAIDVVTGRDVASIDAGSAAFAGPPPPRPHFGGFPVIGLTHVFVTDRNGRIWALDKTTLQPQWMTRPKGITGGATQISVAYDDRLLVKALNGRLYCFEGSQRAGA